LNSSQNNIPSTLIEMFSTNNICPRCRYNCRRAKAPAGIKAYPFNGFGVLLRERGLNWRDAEKFGHTISAEGTANWLFEHDGDELARQGLFNQLCDTQLMRQMEMVGRRATRRTTRLEMIRTLRRLNRPQLEVQPEPRALAPAPKVCVVSPLGKSPQGHYVMSRGKTFCY
jgi:hypothetical protein